MNVFTEGWADTDFDDTSFACVMVRTLILLMGLYFLFGGLFAAALVIFFDGIADALGFLSDVVIGTLAFFFDGIEVAPGFLTAV